MFEGVTGETSQELTKDRTSDGKHTWRSKQTYIRIRSVINKRDVRDRTEMLTFTWETAQEGITLSTFQPATTGARGHGGLSLKELSA